MKFQNRFTRPSRALAVTVIMAAGLPVSAATFRFDNGAGTGAWGDAQNWNNANGPDGVAGNGDDNSDGVPGSTDVAEIYNTSTVNVSDARSVQEIQLGNGAGTATLNVTGGSLALGGGNNRIGREFGAGGLGSAAGHLIQTGGAVTSTTNVNMSYDKLNSADSLWRVSGGSVDLSAVQLRVGRNTQQFNRAEFEVVGSAATAITIEDMLVRRGTNTGSEAVISFVIDAGGVTTIVVEDELNFGNATLELSLSAAPPTSDIVLFDANRLTSLNSNPLGYEPFLGLDHGGDVSVVFGGNEYTWTINYRDVTGDSAIWLNNLRVEAVPEPTSLALLSAAGMFLARRGRR